MVHYHKYEERIKAQGCGKPYIRFNVCECGDKQYIGPSKAIQPHTYEVNKRLKEPSCTEEGEDELICTACGEIVNRPVPVLGHDYTSYFFFRKCRRCGKKKYRIPVIAIFSAAAFLLIAFAVGLILSTGSKKSHDETYETTTTQETSSAYETSKSHDETSAEFIETTTQEPVTEEVTTPEITTEEFVTEDPTAEETTAEMTTAEETTTQEPETEEPTTEEPTTSEATTEEPTTEVPTTPEPTTPEPTTTAQPQTQPTTMQQTTPEPTTARPTEPEPTTTELVTEEPTTPEPTTPEPTTATKSHNETLPDLDGLTGEILTGEEILELIGKGAPIEVITNRGIKAYFNVAGQRQGDTELVVASDSYTCNVSNGVAIFNQF